jgi:hypothetical protein
MSCRSPIPTWGLQVELRSPLPSATALLAASWGTALLVPAVRLRETWLGEFMESPMLALSSNGFASWMEANSRGAFVPDRFAR